MESVNTFTRRAQLYWALIIAVGLMSAIPAIAAIHKTSSLKLAIYVLFSVAISRFKIRLPGVLGTLSLNYVIILSALVEMNAGAGMIVALTSTLAQCVIGTDSKPRWFQVVFSVTGVCLPVLAANQTLLLFKGSRLDPTGWLSILAASTAYFAINTISVAGIIAIMKRGSVIEVWKTSYLWTSPQYLVGGLIAGAIHYMSSGTGWSALVIMSPPIYLLYRSYTTYLGRVEEQQTHIAEIAALHLRTIETLALAIDAKDDTTAAHLRRVQIYAAGIGREMNLSPLEAQALHAAALLHDVGKLAVPEYIVSKPGKLTPEEFEKMKVHPVVGAEILERVGFPYPVVPIVRAHHEKYDGTGYPDGLSGDQIPIGARILSVVDCLDALSSDRQYREAYSLDEAMQMVVSQSGKAFDPKIVAILQLKYQELEQKAKAETGVSARLSTNVKIERGLAPATGYAEATNWKTGSAHKTPDFSMSIVSARREIQLLTEFINDLGNSLSIDDTLALLAVRLTKVVKHDAVAVYLLQNGRLVPRYVKGESYRLLSSLEIPLGQGLSGWVAENNVPIVNGNPGVEAGYLNDPRQVTTLRSAIVVPLRSRENLLGVLALYSLEAEAFTADDKRLLLAIAPKAAHAVENSLRFERASSAADTDDLTGLANARFLFSHLGREIANCTRSGESFAVIMMDLDRFKQANDHYGHLAGNRILQAVAAGLRRNTRAGDIVARLGGDEFVVILTGAMEYLEDFLAQMDDVTDRLAVEAQCEAPVTISAGVAIYPVDGTDAETLMERADERMYERKRRKRLQVA
jgi:diguanylate cyclase (GGDEF)-like protein/putative nucleotidyltransferase with HDIG domain